MLHSGARVVLASAGRPVLTVPSTYVQGRLDFCSEVIEMSDDPAAYALHAVVDGEVVSHIQPVLKRGGETPAGRYLQRVDEVTIRPARAVDVRALAALARRTWADAFGAGVSADALEGEFDASRSEAYFTKALREKTILVAESDGTLLGYVQFGDVKIPEVEAKPGDQCLQRLYVESTLQGRGLGRRLMEAALAHPRLASAKRIFLQVWDENERAVGLYRSLGFKRVDTTRFSIGSEVMEDAVMLLDKDADNTA